MTQVLNSSLTLNKAILLGFFFLIFYQNPINAQNLSNLKDAKPITISGGFNINTTVLGAKGTELNRDPFYWQFNANMNINLFGIISLPFSATFTKENETFNQPSFNQFGMSPKYKNVTVHLGYRNMSFSNYSLSGLTFLGAGIDVVFDKIPVKISAMYGRFNKAVQFINLNDIEDEQLILEEPAYERRGFGSKISIGKQKHGVDLILFKAKDKLETLFDTIQGLKPEENIVFGINTRNTITKKLNLNIEYTNSTYTFDTRVSDYRFETYRYINRLGTLFTPKLSTQTKNALVSKLSYQLLKANIALMYRRVDPEFQSMGTPGIIGDIEEYTINLSTNILNNKINFSSAIGSQRDNLNNKESQSNKRFIGSANLNYNVNESLNFSTNYSNFNSRILPSRISFADSVKYIQVTENLSLTANYKFGKDSVKHSLSVVSNMQTANTINRTLTDTLDFGTKVYNGNLNYQLNFSEQKLSVNIAASYSKFNTDENKNSSFGPTVGASKAFLNNKLRTNFNYSFFVTKSSNTSDYPIHNFSLALNYILNKHHSFRFNTRYLLKPDAELETIHKYQANFMYNFTF